MRSQAVRSQRELSGVLRLKQIDDIPVREYKQEDGGAVGEDAVVEREAKGDGAPQATPPGRQEAKWHARWKGRTRRPCRQGRSRIDIPRRVRCESMGPRGRHRSSGAGGSQWRRSRWFVD